MSNAKGAIILAGAGLAAFLVWQKSQAKRTAGPLAPQPIRNVNGDMWSRILGGAWSQIIGGAKTGGGQAFTMTDGYGRIMTSDGKPIGSGDPLSDWMAVNLGLPSLIDANNRQSDFTMSAPYDSVQDLTTGEWTTNGGVSPLDQAIYGNAQTAGTGIDFQAAQPFAWYGSRLQ